MTFADDTSVTRRPRISTVFVYSYGALFDSLPRRCINREKLENLETVVGCCTQARSSIIE